MAPSKIGYTINEAADSSSVSRAFLYKEIAAGTLRATKVGRRTVIRAKDLEAWLDAKPNISHGEAA